MIGGLACEAVPVLGQHHSDITSRYKVPHTVHARTLQARAALSGVRDFLEDVAPFAGGVLSQSL